MSREFYQDEDNNYQEDENYPKDAYDAWDMDEPDEGEDDPFEGMFND
jgi:hypothetical protein